MRGRTNKALAGAIGGLAAILIAAPSALASTVTIAGGDTVRVAETGNEANQVTVGYDAGADLYRVADAAAALAPSGTCVVVDAHNATCPGVGIKTVSVATGDRDDSIALDAATIPSMVTENLDGGSANDTVSGANSPGTLTGGSGNDRVTGRGTLNGGTGNDMLTGSPLADNLRGSSGRDTLDGGFAADDISGGSSTDTLLYPGRVNGVNVTIGSGNFNDGGPEDQTGSRRDNVHGDVEDLFGTDLNDVLVGDRSSETLIGLAGDDFIVGNSGRDTVLGYDGNDLLIGESGSDVLRGGPGADRQFGKSGNDRLAGGPDDDFLRGGTGHDVMKGKTGTDRINARDAHRDVKISCGPGPNGLEKAKRDKRLDPRPRSC
ncbi:MAG TPA: calcium-binding protein [Solirubrobacterales bacterium]|nr:calcium-binding protein [Solirubrobacterales bacterium]